MTDRFSSPLVSEPEIVGYFSVDDDGNYQPDFSKLSYYKPPNNENVCFDLNRSIESVDRTQVCPNKKIIRYLLEWIRSNNAKIPPCIPDKWIEPNFVCPCGLLEMLLCTPFDFKKSWIICAAKWRGTIYLVRFKQPENEIVETLKYSILWRMTLPQYLTSDHPDNAPDPSQPISWPVGFYCTLQRKFGSHKVLFSAGIDAVYSKTLLVEPLPQDLQFVEFKTKKSIKYEKQERFFRKFDLLKWWARNFLIGNEKIFCGFRDDDEIVRNLRSYSNNELADMGKDFWTPQICIDYCQTFLNNVSKSVIDECDKMIYKFEKPQWYCNVEMTTLTPTSESWPEYNFMPSSFFTKTE